MLETKRQEINYLGKDFNKIIVNFVEIKIDCLKCHTFSSSKSKAHKHIKISCVKKNLCLFAYLFSFISIIVFKEMHHKSLGYDLVFKRWIYIIFLIIFTFKHLSLDLNFKSTICLDKNCGVTFINKYWFLKYLTSQKISIISTLLKVRVSEPSNTNLKSL